MGIEDTIKKWLIGVALKKAIVSAAKLVVAYCASKGIIFAGTFFGMVIDTGSVGSIELALTAAVNSALTFVRNWLKVKFPGKFSYL